MKTLLILRIKILKPQIVFILERFLTRKPHLGLRTLMTIDKIRVSIGSAAVLGLDSIKFEVAPTTCYIMTFKSGKCSANCGFCPQARSLNSAFEKLSRIVWPAYNFKDFLTKLKYTSPLKKFRRICIQTLNYPENFQDLIEIISQIRKISDIPISVAMPPASIEQLKELKSKGVERVGIALDGSTPVIFDKIKGRDVNSPYRWENHFECLRTALDIFGKGNVSTHIIIGLGETQKEVLTLIKELRDLQILPGLFSFTPIKGTKLENFSQPNIVNYRKIQLGRYLILYKNRNLDALTFDSKGDIIKFNMNKNLLKNILNEDGAFLTPGCPGCNRPYYTSRPSGPIYNFPRKLTDKEKEEIYNILKKFVN